MEKVILIRFGQTPSPAVSMALRPHIVGNAFAGAIPGAIMSVFNTNSDLETVRAAVNRTGAFFVFGRYTDVTINLPKPIIEAINKVMGTQPAPTHRAYSMDELLDLIREVGIENLTQDQRQQLESLH
jgi:aspartate aminotransferase-like enzyme